ncbi:hypothetical protein YB2330_004206 [Saitoella coloradoensis]
MYQVEMVSKQTKPHDGYDEGQKPAPRRSERIRRPAVKVDQDGDSSSPLSSVPSSPEPENKTPAKRGRANKDEKATQSKPAAKKAKTVTATVIDDRQPGEIRYWLMKAEPESRIEKGQDVKFSIDDLERLRTSTWEGVRNHEAKKNMQRMRLGDMAFLYHSNCKEPGIAGVMKICKEGYPDFTAWDKSHPYFDAKSREESPVWHMVDVEFERRMERFVSLKELREYGDKELKGLALLRRSQLSVSPVSKKEWEFIMELAEKAVDVDEA